MTFPAPDVQLTSFVGPARTDADVVTDVALDKVPAGGPVYISLIGRRVGSGNTYLAKLQVNPTGQMTLRLYRQVSGTQTALSGAVTVAGLTYTAAVKITMRVQVTGTSPTTVRARVWATSTPEPSTWQVSAPDSSTALQQAGTVGTVGYVGAATSNTPIRAGFTRFVATG